MTPTSAPSPRPAASPISASPTNTSAETPERRHQLNRLRFPPDLESAFQRDYFQRARNTIRAGSALAAVLMIPTGIHNVAIGLRPAAIIDGALAVVALLLFAVVTPKHGSRFWKLAVFAAAAFAATAVAVQNAIWLPHLPGMSPEHAETLTLLAHMLLLVYSFVIGRFTFRWYMAFAAFDLAVSAIATAIWFPGGLAATAWEATGSVLPSVAMLGLLAYRQERAARSEFLAQHLLAEEHARAEHLLLNVLPASVAARLKANPGTIADDFDQVGILFADIVDFTPLAASLPAADIVRLLNDVFTTFDSLADRHGMEKIKTIGDAYMAAVGLPEPREDHAAILAEMALEMQSAVAAFRRPDNGQPLAIRIGINVGPVVAGVIGARKFIYDLWGDTVNIASRLESQGVPGRIQCTEAAYQLLESRYTFEGPRMLTLKGRGEMPVWLLGERHKDGCLQPLAMTDVGLAALDS